MAEIRVSHAETQDLLDGLGDIQKGVDFPEDFVGADGDVQAPSVESLLKALEGMSGLSIEDRDALKTQLLQQKMRDNMGEDVPHSWGGMNDLFLGNQLFVLFALLIVIASIFVFFGLKLYRSLTEKERKREEKKKLKMQKKKK